MKAIFSAIAGYAAAYETLEGLQRAHSILLPVGDQKTGVIGEFFARIFAKDDYPGAQFEYGTASQPGWDISIRRTGLADHRIQVKAVSCYSTMNRVSPIHPGWHELYLMRLNKKFLPDAFWVVDASKALWSAGTLKNKTMPRRNKRNTGSLELRNWIDRLDDLRCSIKAVTPDLEWD